MNDASPLGEPAESLGLPHQVLWRLQRHTANENGEITMRTVSDVLAWYRIREIDQVPGLGPTRVRQVRDALERAGVEVQPQESTP